MPRSERHQKQGETGIPALCLLLILNAIVFVCDRWKMWWHQKLMISVWRRRALDGVTDSCFRMRVMTATTGSFKEA
jgi:hypothetical protein